LFTRSEELLGLSLTRSTSGIAPGLGDDRGFEVFGTRLECCFFDLLVVLVGTHASRVIDYVARKEPRGVVDVQVGGL
jgi:hypothetical protein